MLSSPPRSWPGRSGFDSGAGSFEAGFPSISSGGACPTAVRHSRRTSATSTLFPADRLQDHISIRGPRPPPPSARRFRPGLPSRSACRRVDGGLEDRFPRRVPANHSTSCARTSSAARSRPRRRASRRRVGHREEIPLRPTSRFSAATPDLTLACQVHQREIVLVVGRRLPLSVLPMP